jgi:Dolichyl-phosphate-mannose-protein mannosyltransferase/Protein of unknown function (DUF1583)
VVSSRMWVWIRCLLALFALIEGETVRGDEYHQDFRSERLDSKSLLIVTESDGCRLEPGSSGLRIRIQPRDTRHRAVGVATRFRARGDFEITFAYELLQVGPPATGYGAGIGLEIRTDSAESETASLERLVCPGGLNLVRAGRITTIRWGQRTRHYEEYPAQGRTGRLQIARRGSLVRLSCGEGDHEFRTCGEFDVGKADVDLIRLLCTTGGSGCGVDVLVKDLVVRAATLVEIPDQGETQSLLSTRNMWPWRCGLLAIAGAALIACLASCVRALDSREPGDGARIARRYGSTALVAGGLAVAGLSTANHLQAVGQVGYHYDENIWTTRSYFYRLAVLDWDFDNRLWEGENDGLDAPHINDLLIGASMHLTGQPLPPIPEHSGSWGLNRPPAGDHLLAARAPSALLGSLVAPLVYLIGVIAFGRLLPGLVAGAVYACHPLVLLCQPRAMLEGPLMFFSALTILILTWGLVRNGSSEQPVFSGRRITVLMLAPLCLALAIGVKLTGIFIAATVGGTLAFDAATDLARSSHIRARLWRWIAYLGFFLWLGISWVIWLNPTLHPNPYARFRAMIELRRNIARGQAASFPQWALERPTDQVLAAYEHVGGRDLGAASVPLSILACTGLIVLLVREVGRLGRREPPSPALAVLAWFVAMVAGMLPTLPLNWERYFLPLVPCWALFAGVGTACFFAWLGRAGAGAAIHLGKRVSTGNGVG